MKKVIMVCFLLFAFLYVSIGCEDDKGGSYSLTGTVSNKLREPIAGRTLLCISFNEDSRLPIDTLSEVLGSNGDFSFTGLDFGNYSLQLISLDTLDSFRTFIDTTGLVTRKAIYSNGRFINNIIGIARNEVLNDTMIAAGATASKITGTLSAKDTIRTVSGTDSIVSRANNAIISLTLVPDTNWSNPILKGVTADTTGVFEIGSIPRVKANVNPQTSFMFNCRIDRAGYKPVRIDSISADAATIDLGLLQLFKQ